MIRIVPGWMCQVDWNYELGEASGGTRIFASEADLKKYRKCTACEDPDHIPQEVVVLSVADFHKLVKQYKMPEKDFYSSNIGEVIWSKEKK